jgi:hypothetical protein
MANLVQLSTDGLAAYADAVERAFGADIDYGQAVKFYEAEPAGSGRYNPPKLVDMERSVIAGNPDEAHISTSIIERQNLTMRMGMRDSRASRTAFGRRSRIRRRPWRCILCTTTSCGRTRPCA